MLGIEIPWLDVVRIYFVLNAVITIISLPKPWIRIREMSASDFICLAVGILVSLSLGLPILIYTLFSGSSKKAA